MTTESFTASVQYGDFKGTVQADDHDVASLRAHLHQRSLIREAETLVGIEVWSGDTTLRQEETALQVTVLLAGQQGYDNVKTAVDSGEPLRVRRINMEMPYATFFSFFKRFSISMSAQGIIDGREIAYDE